MMDQEIFSTLEELEDEEFEEFKLHLQNTSILSDLPQINKPLEKAVRENIADWMAQTYTRRCVELTSKILEKINRNDLKQRFLQDKAVVKRMCLEHDKPLELFCRTDRKYVCKPCVIDHKNHDLVPLRNESEVKKAELRKTEAEVQEMIQIRRLKIQEKNELMKISKDAADREKAEGVQIFTALKESAERGLKELIKEIEDNQEKEEKQAEDFIKDLEQEISELMKRSSEVKQLLQSEDHLHLLQSFSSLIAAPPTTTRTDVIFLPPLLPKQYKGTAMMAVLKLEAEFRNINMRCHRDFMNLQNQPQFRAHQKLMMDAMKNRMEAEKNRMKAEIKRVQQYAVDVTLDPDTAHPNLILSDDGKQVKHGDVKKKLPNNPERIFNLFSKGAHLLGQQSFSSGKFYFEVQVKGKTDWDLGVARESINRKGRITLRPQNGFWTAGLRNRNEYIVHDYSPVRLPLNHGPEKVGVFVDYEEGLVSFCDVGNAALIYSFIGCCFNGEKLYPYFNPGNNAGGRNSSPLIICPVNDG